MVNNDIYQNDLSYVEKNSLSETSMDWFLKNHKPPQFQKKDEIWENIEKSIEKSSSHNILHYSLKIAAFGIAATLIIIFGISYFFMSKPIEQNYICERGSHQSLQLHDGSLVDMNSESTLKFKQSSTTGKRFAFLKGEAFFEIIKGEPFTIETDEAFIKIKGTSFNIFARNGKTRVICHSGSVIVIDKKSQDSCTLEKNQFAESSNIFVKTESTEKPDEKKALWVQGEFPFENSEIREVFEELQRQFNVELTYNFEPKGQYTGYFKSDNLLTALECICIPMGLKYKILEAGKVHIYK